MKRTISAISFLLFCGCHSSANLQNDEQTDSIDSLDISTATENGSTTIDSGSDSIFESDSSSPGTETATVDSEDVTTNPDSDVATETSSDSDSGRVDDVAPHVSYVGGPDHTLHYATNKSGTWEIEDLGYKSNKTSIAVDSQNRVHIVFEQPEETVLGRTFFSSILHLVKRGGGWVATVVDEYGYVPSMALDSSDILHIAYAKNFIPRRDSYLGLKYAFGADGLFHSEAVDAFNGDYPDVAIGINNVPHFVFSNFDGLKHGTVADKAWTSSFIDTDPEAGPMPSITIDNQGNAFAVYETDKGLLQFANNIHGDWVTETIDKDKAFSHPAIDIALDGVIHVAYSYSDPNDTPHNGIVYSAKNNQTWNIEKLNLQGPVFVCLTMQATLSGDVHNLYVDTYNNLIHTSNANLTWHSVTIDSNVSNHTPGLFVEETAARRDK